jgi:hypothetical protein
MTHTIDFDENDLARIISAKTQIREKVKYLISIVGSHYDDMYLTGGAVASLLQGETPKDWDIYFRTEEAQKEVISTFVNSFSDEIAVYDEKYRDIVTSEKVITENATSLKNGIQFITKYNGSPDVVRESFDFVHCKPYFDFRTNQLFISKEQYNLCLNKKLKINNMKSVTAWRQEKFEKRGYTWQS